MATPSEPSPKEPHVPSRKSMAERWERGRRSFAGLPLLWIVIALIAIFVVLWAASV